MGAQRRTKRRAKSCHDQSPTVACQTNVSCLRKMLPLTFKLSLLLAALLLTDRASSKKSYSPIQEAIHNGLAAEYDRNKCIWRRGNDKDLCPDPDIRVFLYAPDRPRRELDSRSSDWLRQDYDPTKESVILLHGYAGDCPLTVFLL